MIPVEDMPLETPRYGANADLHYKKNALHYTQRKNETLRGMPLIETAIYIKSLLDLHEKCPSLYTE